MAIHRLFWLRRFAQSLLEGPKLAASRGESPVLARCNAINLLELTNEASFIGITETDCCHYLFNSEK